MYLLDNIKIGFFLSQFANSSKKIYFLIFMINIFFLQFLIHLYSVQLFLLFLLVPKNHLFWKKRKVKINTFTHFSKLWHYEIVFCWRHDFGFSLYSYKCFKDNLSLPVIVFDWTFLTNFSFDNMFLFDLRCIRSETKKSTSVGG